MVDGLLAQMVCVIMVARAFSWSCEKVGRQRLILIDSLRLKLG